MTAEQPFEIPILFLTFNRLDTVKRVFAEIKKTNVKRLYISSDGARKDVDNEDRLSLISFA